MNQKIVVHISIDGLTPHTISELGENYLPTIYYLQKNGIFTHDARTDPNYTVTLPNHSTMLTGRGVRTAIVNGVAQHGHYITFNSNNNNHIHAITKNYVYSIFDIVKNSGYRSGMFVGKSKFEFLNASYNDNTGINMTSDGIDEIDIFYKSDEYKMISDTETNTFNGSTNIGSNNEVIPIVQNFINTFNSDSYCHYNFIHFRGTDSVGHMYGWDSNEYKYALRGIDHDLASIVETLRSSSSNCYIILSSDHGGGGSSAGESRNHHDPDYAINFTIPLYVWRNDDVMKNMNRDIYSYNPQRIKPAGDVNPQYEDNNVPIRNGDIANLALKLLTLPKVPGSWINSDQDLFIPA